MNEVSSAATTSTSNGVQGGLQTVARALAAAPLSSLSAAIARDDSTVCRIRSEEVKANVSDVVRLLYAAGLKVVSVDRVCVDRATYEAMSTIASKAMANPDISRRLTWDDAE